MLLTGPITIVTAFLLSLSGVTVCDASPTGDAISQRQISRQDVVNRASRTRPKRAAISGRVTCSTFYLRNTESGLYVRKEPAIPGFVFWNGDVPVDKVQLVGNTLTFADGGAVFGTNNNNPTARSYDISFGSTTDTPLFCENNSGTVRCRRGINPPKEFDAEVFGNGPRGGNFFGIGPNPNLLGNMVVECA